MSNSMGRSGARYRAAVIGLGRIASTIDDEILKYEPHLLPMSHIGCYRAIPEVELVGLADTWEEQREAARLRWGFDALFSDYRQMLREAKPEIVSVCTNTRARADILLEIANRGYGVRAIFAEKPLTFSLEQADRVIEACRRAGIVLGVNCTRRWSNIHRNALDMVREGIIGDVLHVEGRAGTGLSEAGVHLITTMTMFAPGRAEWLVGELQSDDMLIPEVDPRGAAYVAFPNGVRGYLRTMPNGPNEWSIDVTGTRGMLRFVDDVTSVELWTFAPPLDGARGEQPVRRPFPLPRNLRAGAINAIYDLIHCIETGDTPRCSGEDAREALEIAIATRESHRRGNARVNLPLEDRSLCIVSNEARSDVPRAIRRQRGEG